jgi:hypothetical protein
MDTGDKKEREEEVADVAADVECAICLQSNFPPENPLKKLPCTHKFDLNCLRTLNDTSSVLLCPICRAPFKSTDYEPPPPPPPLQYDNNGLLLYSVPEFGIEALQRIVDTTSHFSEKNIIPSNMSNPRLSSLYLYTQMRMYVDVSTFVNGEIRTRNFWFPIIRNQKPIKDQLNQEIIKEIKSCNYGLLKNVRILNNTNLLETLDGVLSGIPLTNYRTGEDLNSAELFAGSSKSIAFFARNYGVDDDNKCLMENLLTYIQTPANLKPDFKTCTINLFTSIVVIPPESEHLFEADSYQPDNNPFFDTLNEFSEGWNFPFKSGNGCSISGGNNKKRKTNKRKRQTNKKRNNKKKKTNKRKNK